MIPIRLPVDNENRLDAHAVETGPTETCCVCEAILEHLEDLEDVYLAEKTLAEIRAGTQKSIPIEELAAEYSISR